MRTSAHLPPERLTLLAKRVHALGERPLLELLRELERGAELHPALERYARLPADLIAAFGGDRLTQPRIVAARLARIPQPESSAAEPA